MTDLYETLGVASDASFQEIRAAYRRAASEAHPDREGGDTARMADLNRAYETLNDADKRAEYDATGVADSAAQLEGEACSRLIALFQAVLDCGEESDLMLTCRMLLTKARGDIEAQHLNVSRQAARLRKQRNRIRRRKETGINLFEALVDSKVKQADEQLAALERGRTVFARVAEMLETYEAEPQAAMPNGELMRQQQWIGMQQMGGPR